jgi:hypothetical protein
MVVWITPSTTLKLPVSYCTDIPSYPTCEDGECYGPCQQSGAGHATGCCPAVSMCWMASVTNSESISRDLIMAAVVAPVTAEEREMVKESICLWKRQVDFPPLYHSMTIRTCVFRIVWYHFADKLPKETAESDRQSYDHFFSQSQRSGGSKPRCVMTAERVM